MRIRTATTEDGPYSNNKRTAPTARNIKSSDSSLKKKMVSINTVTSETPLSRPLSQETQ